MNLICARATYGVVPACLCICTPPAYGFQRDGIIMVREDSSGMKGADNNFRHRPFNTVALLTKHGNRELGQDALLTSLNKFGFDRRLRTHVLIFNLFDGVHRSVPMLPGANAGDNFGDPTIVPFPFQNIRTN